jgi:hypothetical protein
VERLLYPVAATGDDYFDATILDEVVDRLPSGFDANEDDSLYGTVEFLDHIYGGPHPSAIRKNRDDSLHPRNELKIQNVDDSPAADNDDDDLSTLRERRDDYRSQEKN